MSLQTHQIIVIPVAFMLLGRSDVNHIRRNPSLSWNATHQHVADGAKTETFRHTLANQSDDVGSTFAEVSFASRIASSKFR